MPKVTLFSNCTNRPVNGEVMQLGTSLLCSTSRLIICLVYTGLRFLEKKKKKIRWEKKKKKSLQSMIFKFTRFQIPLHFSIMEVTSLSILDRSGQFKWTEDFYKTTKSIYSSEPADRFWALLRGDLLGEALSRLLCMIWLRVSGGIQLMSTSFWLDVPISTFWAGRFLFLDSNN